jgi:HD-GYP domain-containing protein (c-di-GMP phosphodiesterase class II)
VTSISYQYEDKFGDKVSREFELVGAAGQGILNAASDAWENKGESALKIGGGLVAGAAIGLVSSKGGLLGKVVGTAALVSLGLQVAQKGTEVGGAMVETWTSPERLEENKTLVGNSIGSFVVDGLLMSAGGYAGARFSASPTVQGLASKGWGEIQARLPARVFWKEEKLMSELAAFHSGTAEHSRRVGSLSKLISEELGMSTRQQVVVQHAGKMHDVGKLEVPHSIVSKPGELTAIERKMMEVHTASTFRRLDELHYPRRFAETPKVAAGHHESIDGSGYHLGLKGDQVTAEMRVLKVADEWDALTSARDYKPRWPIQQVESALQSEVTAGHMDGQILSAFYRTPAAKVLEIMSNGKVHAQSWMQDVSLRRLLDVAVYGAQQRTGEPSFRAFFDQVYGHPSLRPAA